MIHVFGTILIFLISMSSFSSTATHFYFENEEPEVGVGTGQMASRFRDALFSFDYVQERTDAIVLKLKNSSIGEYSEKFLFMAPLLTGNIEFDVNGINVFYNHSSERSGVRYNYRF